MADQSDISPDNPALRAGLRRHIASPARDHLTPVFGDLMRPTDDVLIQQGGGQGLKIYDEIERDPLAYAVLGKRKRGLVARPWRVEAGGPRRQDRRAAELVENGLNGAWGWSFDQLCLDMLSATLKGYSVVELIWDMREGWLVPVACKPKDPRRFVFDTEDRPRLLTAADPLFGEELPDRKFLIHRFGDQTGDPYGRGLGHQLFWWVFFKRLSVQFWMVFAEKFGSPTVVGKIPTGTSDAEEDAFFAKLVGLIQQSVLTVPDGMVVEFLEAVRSGTVTYPELVDYCDRMITICVGGETLTTSEGTSGSRALGQVHGDVRDELIDSDADLLSGTLNAQLAGWITQVNFQDAAAPTIWRPRPTREEDEERVAQAKLKTRADALSYTDAMRRAGWVPEDPDLDITELWSGRWTWSVAKPPSAATDPVPIPPPALASPLPAGDHGGVADLVAQTDQLAGGAMDALVNRVRTMLDRVGTLEEAQAALAEIYPTLPVADLAQVVGRAMALSNLTGRVDAARGDRHG